jgi:hypothetical protein
MPGGSHPTVEGALPCGDGDTGALGGGTGGIEPHTPGRAVEDQIVARQKVVARQPDHRRHPRNGVYPEAACDGDVQDQRLANDQGIQHIGADIPLLPQPLARDQQSGRRPGVEYQGSRPAMNRHGQIDVARETAAVVHDQRLAHELLRWRDMTDGRRPAARGGGGNTDHGHDDRRVEPADEDRVPRHQDRPVGGID